jgi:hypothetical protein
MKWLDVVSQGRITVWPKRSPESKAGAKNNTPSWFLTDLAMVEAVLMTQYVFLSGFIMIS